MALVTEVVQAVLAAVDSDAGPNLVAGWCSERYRELTNRASFRHLLREYELTLPALIDDGLVTATPESTILVGDATARAAWAAAGPEALTERVVRIAGQRNWFRIVGMSGQDLLLESGYVAPFGGAPAVADFGYILCKRFNKLAMDVRTVMTITHPRLLTPLEEVTHQEADQAMTARVLAADLPRYWLEHEHAGDGSPQVEIYPYARTAQLVKLTAQVHAPTLTLDSQLPNDLDEHILKAGVLVDVYRWEMAKALRAGHPEIAATWRNEMNTQATKWDMQIREAIKQGRVSKALSFQMHTHGFPSMDDRRIRNAYDFVWMRGNRP